MPRDFLSSWLEHQDKNPDNLSENAVVNDRWDRKFFDQMLGGIDEFLINHDRLCKKVDTGSPMWADLFWLLWKFDPKTMESGEIKPSHIVNFLVGTEMEELPEFRKLKMYAEGDDIASALACIDLEVVLESLFDKLEKLRDQLQQIQEQMQRLASAEQESHDLDEMVAAWKAGFNPDADDPQEGEDLNAKQTEANAQVEALKQALAKANEEVEQETFIAEAVIRQHLRGPLENAADSAAQISAQSQLWGDEGGPSVKLPIEERLELAKRLQNPRFKNLFDLIGPLRRIMEDAEYRKVDDAREEIYQINIGNDLQRVLPAELAKLRHPKAKYEFYRKFVEHELPMYDMRGEEKVGRGKIIACLDNSGSMQGQKEMWGKAVAITGLHLARKQRRDFYGIHFGSASQLACFDFAVDSGYGPHQVVEYVEFFYGGGTDFMRPLSVALDQLREEYAATGKVKGDIIFITDGICNVHDDWLEDFIKERDRLQFRVYGFLIDGRSKVDEPLATICENRVWEVADLLDGDSTSTMFGDLY